jgi:nitroimidazol reductase NimA-like FMN-containing flavoprotein (pyridoxamine 5'-phosphate oxidase superfamily)
MTIATADTEGIPWVSPVFYVPDAGDALYWVSDGSARHSQNIRRNPTVAIVIYETDRTDAVYITARAAELTDEAEVRHAMHVLQGKPQPDRWVVHDVPDVVGASPWRIYMATPERVEVRFEMVKNGKVVVGREPTDLLRGRQ